MIDSRNPYINESGIPKLKTSVIAFVDILGYRKMTKEAEKEGKGQKFLEEIHKSLSKAKSRLFGETVIKKIRHKDFYAINTFTDNIVIGYPMRDDAETELVDIFSKLASFQFKMALDGFFLRGAISIGDIYIDEIVVYAVVYFYHMRRNIHWHGILE